MSQTPTTDDSNHPDGHEQFTVADTNNENAFHFDNRPDADEKLEKAQNAPGVEPELFPPGESPAFLGGEESENESKEDDPTEPLTDDVEVVEHVDANDDEGTQERELIRTSVTFNEDGEPEMIEGLVEPDEHAPVFEMQGSTAVFLGPAFADRVETAADAVEQLPFVQAVDMEDDA